MLIRLNLLLLEVVSFFPFPTRLLAEYTKEREAERVAATVYGINLLLTLVLVSADGGRRWGMLNSACRRFTQSE